MTVFALEPLDIWQAGAGGMEQGKRADRKSHHSLCFHFPHLWKAKQYSCPAAGTAVVGAGDHLLK